MLFILKKDFYIQIPELQFNKLIGSDDTVWETEIPRTIDFVKSFLRARYDLDVLFNPFQEFDVTETYAEDDRIIWDVADYVAGSSYDTGEYAAYSGVIYKAKEDNVTGPWNAAKWTEVCDNESIFYCLADATTGHYPDETAYFTEGDTRQQDLIYHIIDVALYNIYSRLNAADIPDIRKERYDGNDSRQTGGAIGWLKMIAKGTIQPDFPLNETNQDDQTGNKIIYGSATTSLERNEVF